MPYRIIRLIIACVVIALPNMALAQDSPDGSAEPVGDMRDLLENQDRVEALVDQASEDLSEDSGRARTPLQLLAIVTTAYEADDLEKAGDILDMRYLPPEITERPAANLAQALRIVWQQQNIVDPTRLSDQPEGHLDDGLPEYRDLLGTLTKVDGTKVPVYIQRVPDGEGGQEWKISNATVARIPELWADLGYGEAAAWLQLHLPHFEFAGMQSWQILGTFIFAGVSIALAALIASLMRMGIERIWPQYPIAIARFFGWPVRIFLFLILFRALMDQLALSLTTRIYLNSSGIDYVAFVIIALGLINLLRDMQARRMERAGNQHLVALLRPFTTIVKFLLIIAVGLLWAERAGYNMTTIIAGLGVGSLAVALAAQKTLENVIGAITLYAARPVNPGDLCRFGNFVGVVEEIGLRSTVIRTLDRTLLAVPNSVFAAAEIENFSHRDRIRFFRYVELQMTTADQLRVILGRLRELFHSHADVIPDTISIRLEKIESAIARIRIDAGIGTNNYQEFLAVAEDLNLRLIESVHETGAVFSGPGQSLQVREFQQASDAQMDAVEQQLQDWEAGNVSPLPDLSPEEKARLHGQVDLIQRDPE